MRQNLPHRCHPTGHNNEKGIHQVSSGLPDLSPMQDVLSSRCNHHFTGKINSGRGFMGLNMNTNIKCSFLNLSVLAFTGIPLLIWLQGDFPERSLLKTSLSVITILAFWQMIGQFFWARTNRYAVKNLKMDKLIKYHKFIGYTVVIALLLHPVLLVVPRFFESGVAPVDAFITIITTFNQGIVLGIVAWCLMLALGMTSIARKKLPMKYKTWRIFHGTLAMMFISIAAWHVIELGRHSSLAMSVFISMLTAGGILILLKSYTSILSKKTSEV